MYYYSKKHHKKINVRVREGLRMIVEEATGNFSFAYPKNSPLAEATLFWETASNTAVMKPEQLSNGKINYLTAANLCANLSGLTAFPEEFKEKDKYREFVFAKTSNNL